jgi:SAM-dependent methyltransferase
MELKEYRKLHAEWYELGSDQSDCRQEIDFWARSIAGAGGPALELGSGTGRVLIPLLERGIDITGIDTSREMLDRCRARCAAKGLQPSLSEQPMQSFSLPRQFGLIFLASGGLSLFTDDHDIHATFARVMTHLKPGGTFIYDFEHAPALEERVKVSNQWTGGWLRGPGDVLIVWRRMHKPNAAARTWEQVMVFEKFVGGRFVEAEAADRVGREFLVDEVTQFARAAGFEQVVPTHWLTEEPPRKESRVVTVRCRKPGA